MNEQQLEALKEQFRGPDGNIDLVAFQRALESSPEMMGFYQREIEKAKQGQRSALSSELIDLGLNAGYLLFGRNQARDAQQKAANMAQPGIPVAPGLSPELTQAIYNAQRGVDYAPALNPARQGIEDAYTGALNQAQTASGGQAGAYQAMSQLANIERMKAQLGLAPIAQQITTQNQGMLNDLLGARVDERQRNYMNQYYGSQMAMDQYNRNRDGLSDQLSAGRTNMMTALGGLSGNLQNLTPYYRPPQFGQRETLKDWVDKNMGMFDEETANYMRNSIDENASKWSPQSAITNNPYDFYTGSYAPDTFGQMGTSQRRPMYS
jgi:hypothetical protein